ncbi:ribonuclease D [Candidatus Puniceispirillum sp.]|jgi:ribonuclease D|uniref:ribonuclease D n=1 Tax=Candidatus Puniceispirillum sp. TaxID=2026719 RepID=UPI001EC37594|nr:ribonuclease D [Candidatus Puniceispirillum sp.]MBT6566120.1 ribonuclease D [Candidatus Puniceispirillum sp.]
MAVHIYKDDLPASIDLGKIVAIDTETMGLKTHRDRLCLVQLSSGDGNAHLVQISNPVKPSPVLAALLADPGVTKLFHFARFDLAALTHYIGPIEGDIYCTKIASKLARTYTDRHGLKDLCRELIQTDISKQQQSSDWGADTLSSDQQNYAAGDVLYLHAIREKLSQMLERENRMTLATACFDFLVTRAKLDLIGFDEVDIFHH